MSRPQVVIHTDGSSLGNPGAGGWAARLECVDGAGHPTHTRELAGAWPRATNNQMELLAAIQGLAALRVPCRVQLVTDSKYLGGALGTSRGRANRPLVAALRRLAAAHEVAVERVAGHAGHAGNEAADRLARRAAETLREAERAPVRLLVLASSAFPVARGTRALSAWLARQRGEVALLTASDAPGGEVAALATAWGLPCLHLPPWGEVYEAAQAAREWAASVLPLVTHVVAFGEDHASAPLLAEVRAQGDLPLHLIPA